MNTIHGVVAEKRVIGLEECASVERFDGSRKDVVEQENEKKQQLFRLLFLGHRVVSSVDSSKFNSPVSGTSLSSPVACNRRRFTETDSLQA